MTGVIATIPRNQFFDALGKPLAGGKLYTYLAGTTTPAATYQDQALTTKNENGIPLDANGACSIWLDPVKSYKFVLKDKRGVTVPGWPIDDISGASNLLSLAPTLAQFPKSSALAARDGASLVGFAHGGIGAVPRSIQDKLRELVSVLDFGAKGDGEADDTASIQKAINAVAQTGGALYLPAGNYKITSALVVDTSVYATGIILYGDGRKSIINQVGAGMDAVKFSTTQFLQNSGMRDLQIVCSDTAGHCINIVYGCTTCFFDNLDLVQGNPKKALIYGDYEDFGGGIYDTKFRGGSWYCAATSTEAGFRVKANGTIFNENVFENLRCYHSKLLQFFHITTVVTASVWLINNTWKNINFETCLGGGFHVDSLKNCKFENISFWDASGAYSNHLLDLVAGVGFESAANTFINVGRNGDTLVPGVRDIRIVSGQDTVIINCFTQSADGPSYDFNGKRVTVIGRLYGALNAGNATVVLPESFSGPTVFANDVYGDTLHIGGRSTSEAVALTYGAGYTQVNTLPASAGVIVQAKDGAGNAKKLVWTATELFPLTDSGHSLGLAANRWTQVYATTATINTSDERSKQQIGVIHPAVLRAWAKVQFCQFKFVDAAAMKGDGARWHFGVIAQRVKEAFESEGLDPFAYGLLCYDSWDATEAVLDEDGAVVIPARPAGNRYGIRYEEALALECAYLRSKLGA